MNITHIKDDAITVPITLEEIQEGIFETQRNLHHKYKPIEYKSGLGLSLVKDKKFNLDDPHWQYIIKDFAWRVTEELTEAVEAKEHENEIHHIEELIDAVHFYTELLIICGYGPEDLNDNDGFFLSVDTMRPTYYLGIACNLLKNKPWKQTHLVTDEKRFKENLILGYNILTWSIVEYAVKDWDNLYMIYHKKSLVNQFRQNTNY